MIHNNVKITTDISNPTAGFVELERETGGYICRSDSRKLGTVLNWSRIISTYITNKCEVTYSYITSKCKVTAVFNEGVARVETCCYFALMSYVTRLFTE